MVDKMKKMDWVNSILKFEGGADVEEYLTWELKIEKLWSLHPHYSEDRKIKLASSEFDGYALRWWDSLIRKDGAQPIRTWRAMKEAMTSRFVPTNYMRNIFDKLTLLRQGVKTVDEYYMEMEMLMQRGRVRESLEMTMQCFLNGLKNSATCFRRHQITTIKQMETSIDGRGANGHEDGRYMAVKSSMELDMKISHGRYGGGRAEGGAAKVLCGKNRGLLRVALPRCSNGDEKKTRALCTPALLLALISRRNLPRAPSRYNRLPATCSTAIPPTLPRLPPPPLPPRAALHSTASAPRRSAPIARFRWYALRAAAPPVTTGVLGAAGSCRSTREPGSAGEPGSAKTFDMATSMARRTTLRPAAQAPH
ncbi:hypothetical protein QYE76_017446 [Lolium multiflorum]|uniref:Retrotransposon gag domain-containing protein n=1 Tax=Lolium multiflorum TaxID=4521 RepID=A0AAD8QHV5_LOLMU|nr:hypothetical protein QYE76_017446 [Lolium multiflorum]